MVEEKRQVSRIMKTDGRGGWEEVSRVGVGGQAHYRGLSISQCVRFSILEKGGVGQEALPYSSARVSGPSFQQKGDFRIPLTDL